MRTATIHLFLGTLLLLGLCTIFAIVLILLIKALKKYIASEPVRKEKANTAKTLGEVLKVHRVKNKMTQEFVAESLGVSRQAVSKWENGSSDPSTSNLVALAELFGVTPEDLLSEVRKSKEA